MKRRVAVDARPYTGPTNGFTIYLDSILSILKAHDYDITLLSDAPLRSEHEFARSLPIEVLLCPAGKFVWNQLTLLRHLRRKRYDVYFAGSNMVLPLLYFGPTKLILGLLDLIYLRFPRIYLFVTALGSINSVFRYILPQIAAVLKADRVITISASSRDDIRRWFPFKRVDYALIKLSKSTKRTVRKQSQFAYVGGVEARKRVDVALAAFASFQAAGHPEYRMVLIGRGYEAFDNQIARLGIADRVIKTGFVTETEKIDLIAKSQAMVYLSLYEGYGLAIAEAILNGTAVICGPGGAQAEVAGKAALFVDPCDVSAVTKAMHEVVDEAVQRRLLDEAEKQARILCSGELEARILSFFAGEQDA
jgi:glycosyltransferase involved in cell wall biosynthesis